MQEYELLEYEITFEILMYYTIEEKITASTFEEEFRTSRYHDFVIDIISIFERRGYTIEESHNSNRDNSKSMYFTFTKIDDINEKRYKCIVFFRVSDHLESDSTNALQRQSHYYKNEAKKYVTNDYDVLWKRYDIIFDGKTYRQNWQAEKELAKFLDNLEFVE